MAAYSIHVSHSQFRLFPKGAYFNWDIASSHISFSAVEDPTIWKCQKSYVMPLPLHV